MVQRVAGAILCGGASQRLPGPKPLRLLAGRPLVGHVADWLLPQTDTLWLCAGRDAGALAEFGFPVLSDPLDGRAGPLSGLLASLDHAGPDFDVVVTAPCDTPFLPGDLVGRLVSAASGVPTFAASARGNHYVVSAWPVHLCGAVRRHADAGERALRKVLSSLGAKAVLFDGPEQDAFLDINTPADFAKAERLYAEASK